MTKTLKFEDCYPGMLVRVAGESEELKVRRVNQESVIVADKSGGMAALVLRDFEEGSVSEETPVATHRAPCALSR